MDDLSTGKAYIGLAYNKPSSVESKDYADYTWSLIKGEKGDKGDTGPRGATGEQGPRGNDGTSVTGATEHYLATSAASGVTRSTDGWKPAMQPTSDAARYLWNYETITWNKTPLTTYVEPIIIGVHGQKGDQGPQGPQGLRGPTGANGQTLYTWLKYADTPTTGMNDDPTGKAYIGLAYNKNTATEGTNYGDYTWSLVKGSDGVQGPKGADGSSLFTWIKYADTPTTGMNDDPTGKAYIGLAYNKTTTTESTSYSDYTWSLVKGEKGDQGPQGPKGAQGIQGPQGLQGTSQYIHIRYSANANGNPMTPAPQSTTAYIGIVNSTSATAPTGYASYTWSKYRGDNGSQGVQGPPGANGVTTYTWVKFADTDTGTGMNDSPAGKKYIGLAFNKTTQTESTTASLYTWSLMPQNIEIGARNLIVSRDIVQGEYLLDTTGTVAAAGTHARTGFIEAKPLTSYILSGDKGVVQIRFVSYDAEKKYISGVLYSGDRGASQIYNTPANTAYIRASADYTTKTHYNRWMLEKGDIATDWTESPEDVEARIGEKADQSNLDAVVGDIDAIKEDLDTKVDENTFIAQQAAYEEWLTRVDLSATTAEELAATLELATTLIDTDLKGQAQRWSTLEGFVQIDAATGTFTIKSNNNGTQMVLTDDAMSFLSGGELVATITNQYLQIARGIFTASAQIGRHKFEPLSSDPDHFVLSYVGQN